MKSTACCSLRFLHGLVRQEVGDLCNEARGSESIPNVVALEVDIGIDLVCGAVVALVAFESNIMRGGAHPQRFSFHLERRLPNAQMVPRSDDTDGLGVRPTVILRAAKKVELDHLHGHI